MTVLQMRIVPDSILREKAKKIGKVTVNLKKFTSDMIETMHSENGVGLAANQVGSLQRVAVIQLPDWEEPIVLINPEIVKQEGEREVVEGCLSIPGWRGTVKRSEKVRARALGLDGKVIRINPVIDPQNGTFKVTVAITDAGKLLKPGMFVRVKIMTDIHKETLLIPKIALLADDEVFTVQDSMATKVRLELGLTDADYAEVRSGLKEGDQVVIAGHRSMKDSTRVLIVEDEIE